MEITWRYAAVDGFKPPVSEKLRVNNNVKLSR